LFWNHPMAKSQWVVDVTEANFEQEVLERSRTVPVVVDFWAEWCGPCRMLSPILEKLAEERAGAFILAKINTEDAPNLAAAFDIRNIPAVKAFRDGKLLLQFEGLLPEPQLREFIERILPSEEEKLIGQTRAVEETNPVEAAKIYTGVLGKDPRNPSALLGLTRLALAAGDENAAAELLKQDDFVDEFEPEAERLRGMVELRQQARGFGDEAAARRKLEADARNARLRYELGSVLAAAGKYPEALETLLAAGEADPKLAAGPVRETMVKIFHVVGVRSKLADDYRAKLSRVLY
jgi:putative thioredoxin